MYLVIDNRTGAIVTRTSTLERALERIQVLKEQFEWIDGRDFSFTLATN